MSQQIPERLPGGGVDLSQLVAAAQARAGSAGPGAGTGAPGAPGGAPQQVDVPALVIDVDERGFDQIVQLSGVVPVVVDLWAEWCQPCKTLGPILERVTRELGGRVILAKIDVDANPNLAQAFQAQSIPAVAAIIAGRPLPLFQGAMPEAQVRDVFGQLLELAEQQGVAGRVHAPEMDGDAVVPEPEPQDNPAHAEALAALERGDYAGAITAWEHVLAKAPADHEAHAALAQTRLLHRLEGADADAVRRAAAEDPSDAAAQLRVADLDLSGGHVEDAFGRLLDLFAACTDADERTEIRERLLEFFEVVGSADPRVAAARARLANLLY